MKNLLYLFLIVSLFASCQKDQLKPTDQTNEIIQSSITADTPQEIEAKAATCNKVKVSSGVYTTSNLQDYQDIYDELEDALSFMNSSCNIVYNASTTVDWVADLGDNLILDCTDPGCNTFEIHLEPTTVVCYGCSGAALPLCNAAGTNLALVMNSNGYSFLNYVYMSGGLMSVTIDLDDVLNPAYIC